MVQDAVRRFLVNRDFARLWYGQAVFGIGAVVGALLAGTLGMLIGARNLTWLGLIAGGLRCTTSTPRSAAPT